jgi:hypothetical protein
VTIEPKVSLHQPRQINHLAPDGILAKDRLSFTTLIVNEEGAAVLAKNLLQLGPAPARQRDVLEVVLCTGDNTRHQRRGESEALLLVELRVLKCCKALDLVEVGLRQPALSDEEPLGEDCPHLSWKWALNRTGNCPEGRRVQGSELSGSLVSARRTPTTRRLRLASCAMVSTVADSMHGCMERKSH